MGLKFSPGQNVEFSPAGGVAGRYIIVKAMPLEPMQDEPKYRIKGELRGEERVVMEDSLSEDVGTQHDYEAIARSKAALFQRK